MKFGKLLKYNVRNIFFQKSYRQPGRKTSSIHLFLLQKRFICCKGKWCAPQFQYILIPFALNIHTQKLYKTLDCWSRDILSFDFLDKDWDQFLHPILSIIFQEKCFSCYILLNYKILLSDCHYVLICWTICIMQILAFQFLLSQIL